MHDDDTSPDVPAWIAEEEHLLAAIRAILISTPVVAPPSERELVDELVRLRDQIRTAKEEDKPAMLTQFEHQHALLEQLRNARQHEAVDPDSPYFAHIRMKEGHQVRDAFLGKTTRLDSDLHIVDWRHAPISRLYYTYEEGDDYEEDFGGKPREGTLIARKTLTIRGGKLERAQGDEHAFICEDGVWTRTERPTPRLLGGQGTSNTTYHDAAAGSERRLGTDTRGKAVRSDKRLPDIAGLIDPSQFSLITRPPEGFLVIRGTAGSGKTTVALHRIAYLAFHDPSLDSESTMFVVFSRALRDYVSGVLPALGIRRVSVMTYPQWARELRHRHFPHLPRAVRDNTPEVVVRLKAHPATMVALERYIAEHPAPANGDQAIDDWLSVLSSPDVLAPVIRELAPNAFTPGELERAWIDQRDQAERIMLKLEGTSVEGGVELDAEDDALLLRAWQLRVGALRGKGREPLRYRHIALDEVQDFSPLDVRVLIDCLDARKCITLSGDTQQHVMAESGFVRWSDFFRWLGVEGVDVQTLRVAYRSSAPIVQFATALLGPVAEDDAPPLTVRDGPPVEVFSFTDPGQAVAFLAEALSALSLAEPRANVALIAPTEDVADLYFEGLQRALVPRLHRVVDEDFRFARGIEIVEIHDVKGLEFDYVVILEASASYWPDSDAARRLLHVAATRAIHQLWLTSSATLSPIVREVTEARQPLDA